MAALDWSQGAAATLSSREREFLDASRDHADRERREAERRDRRLRALLGATAVFLVLSVMAGVVAFGQRNQARDATDEALAAQTAAEARRLSTLALTVDDFDQALLLAVEARRLDDSVDTRSNLLAVLNQRPQVIGVLGNTPGDSLFDFVVTGDGRHIAIAQPSGVPIYDAKTLRPTGASLAVPVHWNWATPTADGGGFAVLDMRAPEDGHPGPAVRFFDGATGKETRDALPLIPRTDTDDGSGFWPDPTIAVSPDGRWLAVSNAANPDAGAPAYEMIWDLDAPNPTPRKVEHGFDLPEVKFTFDNRLVVAGDGTGPGSGVFVIDPATGTVLSTIPDAHRPIAVDPTGPRIVARTNDLMAVRDLVTGEVAHSVQGTSSIKVLSFASDGRSVALGWQDRSITIWDPANGELLQRLAGHTSPTETLQFVDGSSTLYSTAADGAVIVWDLTGDRRVVSQIHPNGHTEPLPIVYVSPSPDGASIAYIYEPDGGGDLGFFDVARASLGPLHSTRHGRVGWHDWTPDGRFLVTVGLDDAMARLWDPATGETVAEQALPFDSASASIGWRAGGKSVFAGLHEGGVVELGATTLEIIGEPFEFDHYVSNVDISPDDRTLAVGLADQDAQTNSVLLVDKKTRKVRTTLAGVDASWRLYFSPDGSTLAAGGANGLITLIDPMTGDLIGAPMQGVDGPVVSAAFSPDSKMIAAGSFDGTVELWEVERRARVARITPGSATETTYVWFDATGDSVMVASEDGGVWRIPSNPEAWAARACEVAGRNFSRDEWSELMGDRPYRVTCPGLPSSD